MTVSAMAAFQRRAGAAVVRRFANATADFGGGLVLQVQFSRDAVVAQPGDGLLTRDTAIELVTADLGAASVARGTALQVQVPGEAAQAWRIARRTDDTEHGTTQLRLES